MGSINLSHCCHIFPWLCAWDVCYIIICHLLHKHTRILFSLLWHSLWRVQIVGCVVACRSYLFVCTFHHLIIIIVQTYLKTLKQWYALYVPPYSHYTDVKMSTIATQITRVLIVYLTVCPGADQRKRQSSASLAYVRGIHRWPVNSPHKGPVMQKMLPFDDVIMIWERLD